MQGFTAVEPHGQEIINCVTFDPTNEKGEWPIGKQGYYQ